MSEAEHSKKPKRVTIDLEAQPVVETSQDTPVQDIPETDSSVVSDQSAFDHPAEEPAFKPAPDVIVTKSSGNGFLGKLGSGVLGGVVALVGAAGLQSMGQLPNFGSNADVAALQEQVAKLGAAPAFDPAPLQSEITALRDQLAALPAASGADLSAITDKVTALETALASLPAGSGAGDPTLSPAFKVLAEKVATLETAAPAASTDASAVALAIAASGLKAAIDRGGSFAAELETYATVAPASPDVEALRGLAGSGVPSQADLISQFGDAANAMIAASVVASPDAGIFERLTDSAKGLVKTRRVGDIEGAEPDAVVARMEVALQRGDLDTVLKEAATLPDASKAAGKPFLDQVTARRDASTLVTRALGLALTAAGGKS